MCAANSLRSVNAVSSRTYCDSRHLPMRGQGQPRSILVPIATGQTAGLPRASVRPGGGPGVGKGTKLQARIAVLTSAGRVPAPERWCRVPVRLMLRSGVSDDDQVLRAVS